MRMIALAVVAIFASACGGEECLIPPCNMPMAISVVVKSAVSGATITSASVQTTGSQAPIWCGGGTCNILGQGGTFELDISALGYQTVHRSVTVAATFPKCGCPVVDVQHLEVALTPVS